MSKIVYNDCYGGWGLSNEAIEMYLQLKGLKGVKSVTRFGYTRFLLESGEVFRPEKIERNDPALVETVETLGKAANDAFADLKIKELPKGTLYRISEYDGLETVETMDSIEWEVA